MKCKSRPCGIGQQVFWRRGEERTKIGKDGKQVKKESPQLVDHLIGGLLSGH